MENLELVQKAQMGSKEAFNALVNLYADRLHQFLYLKVGCSSDLDDILQETFIRAYQKIHLYKDSYQFSTWLYTIAYHELSRHYKKNKKEVSLNDLGVLEDSRLSKIEEIEKQNNIWVVASKLPSKQYAALWLFYKEEKNYQEMAYVLGVSRVSLKVLLFRAKASMKKLLEREAQEDMTKKKNAVIFEV